MTSELRPAMEVADEIVRALYEPNPTLAAAIIEADREAVRAEQAAELAKWKEQRLLDHGRLLWREDVETHCPNADLCFEYSATVRCSPCAIKQSDAEGVEALSLNNVYQPEVARLNRELAKFKALAKTLAGALGEIAQPDYGYTDILERGCPPEKHIDYFCSMVTWRQRTAREALTSYKEARDV